ncbi:unnamed protein product [Aphanomyces euteiches]
MSERFEEQLLLLKEKERNKEKWERRLVELSAELQEAKRTADASQAKFTEEQHDVEKLQGLTITNLFYTILGSKNDKLKTENEEVLKAKLRYDQSIEMQRHIERDIKSLKVQLVDVINIQLEYEQLMEAKESFIRDHDPETSGKLMSLSEQKANLTVVCKELREAVRAGELVQQALERAEDCLRSAKNWGTYDLLGGGMISTAIKHGRMDDAQDHIRTAQNRLSQFAKELKDVQISISTDLEISGLLSVTDKLKEIGRLVSQLGNEEAQAEGKLLELERQYSDILERA